MRAHRILVRVAIEHSPIESGASYVNRGAGVKVFGGFFCKAMIQTGSVGVSEGPLSYLSSTHKGNVHWPTTGTGPRVLHRSGKEAETREERMARQCEEAQRDLREIQAVLKDMQGAWSGVWA